MTRMKKILLLLAGLVLLVVAGHHIRLALLSDETLIRMRIEEMAGDFNGGSVAEVAAGLAEEYRNETSGMDRAQLLQALRYAVLKVRDEKTRRFALRVEVAVEDLEIAEGENTAHVMLEVRFSRSRQGEWTGFRDCTIDADFRKGEAGWQVTGTRHRWKGGSRGFRLWK